MVRIEVRQERSVGELKEFLFISYETVGITLLLCAKLYIQNPFHLLRTKARDKQQYCENKHPNMIADPCSFVDLNQMFFYRKSLEHSTYFPTADLYPWLHSIQHLPTQASSCGPARHPALCPRRAVSRLRGAPSWSPRRTGTVGEKKS